MTHLTQRQPLVHAVHGETVMQTIPITIRPTSAVSITSLVLALALMAPSAGAQTATSIDPRFQPWIGCWRTMDTGIGLEEIGAEQQPTRACVVPSVSTPGSIDIALYNRATLLSRTAVPLPGTSREKTVDECSGTESAAWDPEDTRLILRAELACARGVKRVETGLMVMNSAGQWVQMQNLAVGKNEATTVARFRFEGDSGAPAGLSFGAVRSSRALRLSTGAAAAPQAVIGVATKVPASLAEAWLLETGKAAKLNAATLVSLADAGVPARVIDVMVAMANPQRFQVGPAPVGAGADVSAMTVASRANMRGGSSRCDMFDDFCYGPAGMGAWGLGWRFNAFDPWGDFSPWGSRFGTFGYGFNPYSLGWGNGFGPGWFGGWGTPLNNGGGPVVIVPVNPNGEGTVRGRAINGRGYTRGADPGMRGNISPAYTPPSSNGGGSSSPAGGSSSGGGGASSGGGRTARPRPPV